MKTLLIMVVGSFFFQLAGGQALEGKVIYERKTNMHKRLPPENENMKTMVPEFDISKQQLLFSGDESIFTSLPEEADIRDQAGQEGGRMNIRINGGSNETYKNYGTEKMIELRELGPKKYIIEDSLKMLDWKLSEDTLTVQGYRCKKASTKNRQGDLVSAWYTEELGVPGGPEQYGGLPGLILKLDVADSWIVFTATEINLTPVKSMVKVPAGARKVSRQEFQKIMNEAFGPNTGGPRIRIMIREN